MSNPGFPSTTVPRRDLTPWIVGALVFIAIASIRLWLVNSYAVALPFWDQWDAEGDYLLRPWIEGTFPFHDLWRAHNEHRILPSRLESLAIYELTGQWNNLYAARVNAFWPALLAAWAAIVVMQDKTAGIARWLVVGVILTGFGLPFAWENFVAGFQSQFYFLLLFTGLGFFIAAWRPADMRLMPVVLALCVLSVLTMAGGLITPVAIGLIYALDRHQRADRSLAGVSMLLALVVITLIAFGTVPKVAGHAPLKAGSVLELVRASLHVFSWPVAGHRWAVLLLWVPGVLMVGRLYLSKSMSRTDMIMAAALAWSAGQGVVLAYGRGHDLVGLASRYTELLTPGLIANAWFAVRAFTSTQRTRWRTVHAVLAGGYFIAFFFGHAARVDEDLVAVRARHQDSLEQTKNVHAYLQTGSPQALDKTGLQLPYPDKGRLRQLLDNPALRGALPKLGAAPR